MICNVRNPNLQEIILGSNVLNINAIRSRSLSNANIELNAIPPKMLLLTIFMQHNINIACCECARHFIDKNIRFEIFPCSKSFRRKICCSCALRNIYLSNFSSVIIWPFLTLANKSSVHEILSMYFL